MSDDERSDSAQPRSEEDVLAGQPARVEAPWEEVADAVAASGRKVVFLDDDPTGTQTVAGVPVLTSWTVDDLRWALREPAPGFFVLTNTRSLQPDAAVALNHEVIARLVEASGAEDVPFVVVSRSDSTLRGHYPVETDAIARALDEAGRERVDAVVIAPAFVDSGRLTVDSVHWARTAEGLIPVGASEFARDRTFGYRSSDLRDYVEEKSAGRWRAADVERITLRDLREGGVDAVAAILGRLRSGHPVVADAACDDDMRLLALACIRAEDAGRVLLYRVGPSFVRARLGLPPRPQLTAAEIAQLGLAHAENGEHGLVVVGSHVAQTTRQLEALLRSDGFAVVELDVEAVVDPARRDGEVARVVGDATGALDRADVVVHTTRELRGGADAQDSLRIAGVVADAVVEVVAAVTERRRPAWIVGKGGITSSDLAGRALRIRRAVVRGPLLPGMTSLWEPVDGPAVGIPFLVFPGNVGGDDGLATAVGLLRAAT